MNIGLVLSGGMAKGAYQIGALRALNNFIPLNEIKYMSCASIGVLNGYAYATDNLDLAEEMWKNICNNDTRLFITQILKSSMLQHNIKNIYDADKKLSFAFYCSLLDLSHRNIVYKDLATVDHSKVPLYLKASVAIPVYNRAVLIDKNSYFDGAFIDNIPLWPLICHDLDYIIVIHFDDTYYKFENTHIDNKVIQIRFPSNNLLKELVTFSKKNVERMIEEGYKETIPALKMFFSNGYEDLNSVYQNIKHLNKYHHEKSLRLTAGILATNLNKITQRFTKRKIL